MPYRAVSHEARLRGQRDKLRHIDYVANGAIFAGLGEVRAVRNSNRWRRLSKLFLGRNPLCSDPFKYHVQDGVTVASEHTHHIVPLAVDISKAYEWSNLQALCSSCHRQIEVDTNESKVEEKV